MSRVYFHTPSDTAELAGAERAWLNHLATGPADNAWDLHSSLRLDRAERILAMAPEVPDGEYGANYLHRYLREAQEATNRGNYSLIGRLVSALQTRMHVDGLGLLIHGVQLHTDNLGLNTALAAGSDPIVLAAKIHGWCESHAWVEGPDRAWLADIIDQGLATGLYRQGMGWDAPYSARLGVVPLLRADTTEPVVMSYSVCEQFPNEEVGDWMPAWPAGVPERWDALTVVQQQERGARREAWYELSQEERWAVSMPGLRADRPWAQLSPATFREVYFHLPLTAYDVMDPGRADRVRQVLADQPGYIAEDDLAAVTSG